MVSHFADMKTRCINAHEILSISVGPFVLARIEILKGASFLQKIGTDLH